MEKQIGQTKDAGFQFGIRRTFPIPVDQAWDFLFSEEGLGCWLGKLHGELEPGEAFTTTKGLIGKVRVWKPHSHIRLNWKKDTWTNMSRLQLRVMDNRGKSTIAFHQEKLLDAAQRAEMKVHWNAVMDDIAERIQKMET